MPSSRGTRGHNYIGIYTNKKVIGIGKIVRRVVANIEDGKLIIKKGKVTEEQKERILGIINETHSNKTLGWDLGRCDHEYTIVEKFCETNYEKTSKGGIQGHRYQNLKEVLDMTILPTDEEIAKKLKDLIWK